MKYSEFIVKPGKDFTFRDFNPDYTGKFKDENQARESLEKEAADLMKFQDILMKHEKYGLLLIFQGMDAAGKDEIIKHIMSNVDPQGCETKSFKSPTEKERRHDYLWRAARALPARGQIGIFNRSYYEHLTTERVHPEKFDKWTLPEEAKKGNVWQRLYKEINNFEEYLTNNGIHILKFFLYMSKEKQRERLLERIARKDKRTGFSMDDIEDRQRWGEFMKYYRETIENTSAKHAPWYIIPDNHHWFSKTAIASIIVEKLKSFHDDYPELGKEEKKLLEKAKKLLENEAK
ncbi:MAG TPA: PPK2 family polyphosphate kinase [Pyrinomonadaceae bacterium]|nr:PPK2 family polyphosphate kinase [Pyrinomonadaceae bacterium]